MSDKKDIGWLNARRRRILAARVILALTAISVLACPSARAQQRYSKNFQASKILQVTNVSGSIRVEVWNRNEIKVTAELEAPAARLQILPVSGADALVVTVGCDNRGRGECGDVNFRLFVPAASSVDVETKRGNIFISGVRGEMVRAHVFDGEIELISLRAVKVLAKNITGNIFFDGELLPGGKYDLESTQGDINIRIPSSSAFQLIATAPLTRRIDLGGFASLFKFEGGDWKRKLIGNVGGGRASLNVMSQRGPIAFMPR
jgi:hypothetical protein